MKWRWTRGGDERGSRARTHALRVTGASRSREEGDRVNELPFRCGLPGVFFLLIGMRAWYMPRPGQDKVKIEKEEEQGGTADRQLQLRNGRLALGGEVREKPNTTIFSNGR